MGSPKSAANLSRKNASAWVMNWGRLMDPQRKELKSIRNFYDSVYHKESKPYAKTSIHLRRLGQELKSMESSGFWTWAAVRGSGYSLRVGSVLCHTASIYLKKP